MSTEPLWLTYARDHIGIKEILGPKHNPKIIQWLIKLKAWWRDDETPWCGTFVAYCFDALAIPPAKNWFRARAWLNWGVAVAPRLGAVAVFERKGGGHVGFLVGETATTYAVLGGNQGNEVNVMSLAKNRLLGCRWPANMSKSPVIGLPNRDAKKSENEA